MTLPLTRKLQVFVSSTFTDLRAERQVAVQAILETGHIPAGMELFAAGNEEQLKVIRRWIDQSDIFLLILGRRYGSLDPTSEKSYTQLEYEYAIASGKPFFSVVMNDSYINAKIRSGESVDAITERVFPDKFNTFRDAVTSKLCKFVDDEKDIRFAIAQSIAELERRHELVGWVSGRQVAETSNSHSDASAESSNARHDEARATFLDRAEFASVDAPFAECDAMRDVRHRATRFAMSDLAILIEGEPGTGRRTLAGALVRQRARRVGSPVFIIDGTEGITGGLRSALRAKATGGGAEVLLYHIEVLPEKEQAEIAQLVHSREVRLTAVRRVRSSADEGDSEENTIRSPELNALLKSTRILLPPLRDRAGDVAQWATFFLNRSAERLDLPPKRLSRSASNGILHHRWPGNLIELDAVIKRALCLTSSAELEAQDLGLQDAEEAILPLKDAVEKFRDSYINRILAHFSGNRTQAARALDVDPRTVFRFLERQAK